MEFLAIGFVIGTGVAVGHRIGAVLVDCLHTVIDILISVLTLIVVTPFAFISACFNKDETI